MMWAQKQFYVMAWKGGNNNNKKPVWTDGANEDIVCIDSNTEGFRIDYANV